MHSWKGATFAWQPARATTGRPDHLAIAEDVPVRSGRRISGRVDSVDTLAQHHIDIALRPKSGRTDHDPFERFFAGKIIFRERRTFIGIFGFGIDNANAALELCLP